MTTHIPDDLGLRDAVVLVSCVKLKLPHAAPARELYTSVWFRKARTIVETQGARWFILSALYGLVAPETQIAPYERTLNQLSVDERRAWASGVLTDLLPEIAETTRVVFLAGRRYRDLLVKPLQDRGLEVSVPMEGLGIGQQLQFLSWSQ